MELLSAVLQIALCIVLVFLAAANETAGAVVVYLLGLTSLYGGAKDWRTYWSERDERRAYIATKRARESEEP
jgi:hypothetical protein